jgi:hypothetical protein
MVRRLPRDVACAGEVWSQHAYAVAGRRRSDPGRGVDELARALRRRDCTRRAPIWVTETGVEPGPGACRSQARLLRRWADAPRVTAAFQYTFREDTAFPVGLADARLGDLRPTYALWRAWSRDRRASAADCG